MPLFPPRHPRRAQAGLADKVVPQLKSELADKGKAKGNARAGAIRAVRALTEKFGAAAESVVVPLLGELLEALADKLKPVSIEAEKAIDALMASLSPHAVKAILPAVLKEYDGKWQSNLGRANILSKIATSLPTQAGRVCTEVIPVLSGLMWDTKPAVKEAATKAMNETCATCTNKDIKEAIPEMIACILEPEKTTETVHKLAGVVFVSEIESDVLSIMCPLLKRGLDQPTTATKRNVARIVENMAKLVDDPYEVEPFVPLLLPQLARAKDEVSDPEARNVCQKAHDQLEMTSKKPPVWKRIEREKVLKTLVELAPKGADAGVLAHVAALAHSMLDLKMLDLAKWNEALSAHLALVMRDAKDREATIKGFMEICAKDVKIEEEKEEADDAEQLCDCQFSLAYGNKVLLNQTTLKLKRGYRYGLCGKNDSGKTSLMRAIANQQVEGFPPPSELRTMFVETDIPAEVAEVPVLEYVVNHEGLKAYGITAEQAREKLLSVGFAEDDSQMAPASLTKQCGRLSGGWRMKCALTRAMLMKADILLLDEPTNHLDPGNVKWVMDYLTSLEHVTSIMVSLVVVVVRAPACVPAVHQPRRGGSWPRP